MHADIHTQGCKWAMRWGNPLRPSYIALALRWRLRGERPHDSGDVLHPRSPSNIENCVWQQ